MALNFGGLTPANYLKSSGPVIGTMVPCTVACWINAMDNTGTRELICLTHYPTGTAIMDLSANYTGTATINPYFLTADDASGGFTANNTALNIPTTGWHHIVGVLPNTTNCIVYFDGGNKTTSSGGTALAGVAVSNCAIGVKWYTTVAAYAKGNIAFPAIWNVALTDAEIAALAKGISPKKIRPSALKSYARLIGASPEPDLRGWTWARNGNPTPAYVANPRVYAP
jgi:hypothetical protein